MTDTSIPTALAYRGNGSAIGLVGSFPSTAELLSYFSAAGPLTHGAAFVTAGRATAGDGGGATFRYDALDTTAQDNGGTVRVDAAGRHWRAVAIRDYVSVRIFGAIADGVTDCSAAIVAANSWNNSDGPAGCLLPPGNYAVARDIALPNRLQGAGGVLVIGAAMTLTLNAAPDGPLTRMFAGKGTVMIGAVSAVGHPEWFGAIANDKAVDCAPAINACVAAFPITQYQRGTYYTLSTVHYTTSGRRNQGMQERNPDDTGTTIAIQSATLDGALVGAASDPGPINSYVHNIDIYGVWHTRTLPVVPPVSGNPLTQTASWRIQYGLNLYMERCSGAESSSGFIYWNVVKSYFKLCQGKRSINGATQVNDVWNGHYLHGFGPTYLASVRFDQCGADCNIGNLAASVGMRAAGSFTDVYINDFEADTFDIGILLDGTGATKPSIDCYLSGGVFDQVTQYGVSCLNQPPGSQIHINKTYVVCTAKGVAGFLFQDNQGSVSLIGNQASGLGAGPSISGLCGLKIVNSSMINSAGNMWSELDGAVYMDRARACEIRDGIANQMQPSANPAIRMLGCVSNLVQPNIDAATIGITLDGDCRDNEINTSAINSLTTRGKLAHAGTAITKAGSLATTIWQAEF